jgi:ribosomal-protein-alanine N-acetyltransferase
MEGHIKEVVVRLVEPRDVEGILAIQAVSPEIAQWTLWDYERVARGEMAGWIAEQAVRQIAAPDAAAFPPSSDPVIGFLIARQAGVDIEILNLAVRPGARRQGVGAALVAAALAWGQTFRAEKALLEVRASNLAALQFYEKHGFRATGRRPRYYSNPPDDGLVLTLDIA